MRIILDEKKGTTFGQLYRGALFIYEPGTAKERVYVKMDFPTGGDGQATSLSGGIDVIPADTIVYRAVVDEIRLSYK